MDGCSVEGLAAGERAAVFNQYAPMDRVSRFELTINQRTAAAIGARVPPVTLTLADDVIE